MGVYDVVNYVLFTNPVTTATTSAAWGAASMVKDYMQPKVEVRMTPPVPLWKLAAASGPYIRLAALSGATAVILGAYGFHRQYPKNAIPDQKQVFETANRFHFIHTLALLGVPLCRAPTVAAVFMLSGMVLFCGTSYYLAFTGDQRLNRVTPIGGVCFIIGWLSMCV